jgi:membrane protein insertase Oxa1/YidC/SpoIIIJ
MIFYISLPNWSNIKLCTVVDRERFSVFRVDHWVQKSGHPWLNPCYVQTFPSAPVLKHSYFYTFCSNLLYNVFKNIVIIIVSNSTLLIIFICNNLRALLYRLRVKTTLKVRKIKFNIGITKACKVRAPEHSRDTCMHN